MAIQGTPLRDVVQITTLDFFTPLPFGDLCTPFEALVPYSITAHYTQRLPVPAIAWAFLTDVDAEIFPQSKMNSGPPYHFSNILAPLSDYVEPNVGQIWPR